MSVNLGQIFTRVRDLDAITQFLVKYLQNFVERNGSPGLQNGKLLDAEGKRTLLVLPVVNNWVTILEGDQLSADDELALALSREFKNKTILFEVSGGSFDYRLLVYENGDRKIRTVLRESYGEGIVMPVFKDAEKICWDEVTRHGVAPQILFVRQCDIPNAPPSSPENAVYFELYYDGSQYRLKVLKTAVKLPLPPLDSRVLLDPKPDGRPPDLITDLVIEKRHVWGNPEPRSVEQMGALLRRVQTRYSKFFRLHRERILFQVFTGEGHKTKLLLPIDLQG